METNEQKQLAISSLISKIKSKTGVLVSVYLEDGTPVFNAKNSINVSVVGKEVFVDNDNNSVIFAMKLFGKKYFGLIKGCSESVVSQALLIKELCESNISRTEDYSLEDFYRELLIGNINYNR